MSTGSIAEQATTALGLALEQPRPALRLAEQARAAAAAAGLDAEEAIALRALGLASRALQEITASTRYLTQAVTAAERAGDADLEAECRVSLASALVFGGESRRALETLDAATPGPRVAVTVASQRAGILTMLGRYDEALGCYDRVVRSLRRAGDRLIESRVLSNRGLLHVYAGRFRDADADLTRAELLAARLGRTTEAAGYCHNRGFAAARQGDLPAALRLFEQADRRYAEAGVPPGARALDEAEALLAAGLLRDARELLERATAAMRAGGDQFALAEGLILLADATHLAGDFEASAEAAGEAIGLLAEQERFGWHALARAALARAALGSGSVSVEVAEAASAAAAALDHVKLATRGLAAHAIAGKVWLAADNGRGDDCQRRAQIELSCAASGRRRGPAAGRAVAWDAEAVRRLAAGDRRGALAALKAAIAVVDTQQAGLSATELRAHISLYADGSATLGLRLAISSGRPGQILGWMERRRANGLRSWPVRPPPDPVLAQEMAELRRLAGEVAAAAASGGDPRPPARKAAQLERSVREQAWRLGGGGTPARSAVVPIERLGEELGDWALIELADCDGDLHAVALGGGRCSHRRLGPTAAVVGELEHLRFALRRGAYGMDRRGQDADALAEAGERLDRLLLAPLRPLIGDRSVVMVPTGALHVVPWSVLPTLAARPLAVSPSAHAWFRASRAKAPDGPVLGVAGPDLPAATAEVRALRGIHPATEILTGRRATVGSVLPRLEGAAVAHIAAHAILNADNGLWSSLRMADGPLTVYELEGLARAPGLVILSACQSGVPAVRPGDEVLGLAAALLALGTRSIIASVLPIDDRATAPFMLSLHTRLKAGDSPSIALASAQACAADAVVAAAFVCFGAP